MLPYIIIHVLILTAFFAWFYNWLTVGDAFYTLLQKCPKFFKNVQDSFQDLSKVLKKLSNKIIHLNIFPLLLYGNRK
jgi:hypothetical protein